MPDILKQIMRIKNPQDTKKTRERYIIPLLNLGKTGGKPAVRKIQVTTQESSESEESPNEQPSHK